MNYTYVGRPQNLHPAATFSANSEPTLVLRDDAVGGAMATNGGLSQ